MCPLPVLSLYAPRARCRMRAQESVRLPLTLRGIHVSVPCPQTLRASPGLPRCQSPGWHRFCSSCVPPSSWHAWEPHDASHAHRHALRARHPSPPRGERSLEREGVEEKHRSKGETMHQAQVHELLYQALERNSAAFVYTKPPCGAPSIQNSNTSGKSISSRPKPMPRFCANSSPRSGSIRTRKRRDGRWSAISGTRWSPPWR